MTATEETRELDCIIEKKVEKRNGELDSVLVDILAWANMAAARGWLGRADRSKLNRNGEIDKAVPGHVAASSKRHKEGEGSYPQC
jgi:hypothetical protein